MSSCVFCKIIAGDSPSEIQYHDDVICIFNDIRPVTKHHFLACPREHLGNINSLNQTHVTLIENLVRKSKELLEEKGGNLQDTLFGFHKPPFNSIGHLHLHVISPASEMSWFHRLAFRPNSWWFIEVDQLLNNIKNQL